MRAPGPGPIRKRDWAPLARRHLEGKKVILHTDGARAYTLKVPGVLHDNVVHMKKKAGGCMCISVVEHECGAYARCANVGGAQPT